MINLLYVTRHLNFSFLESQGGSMQFYLLFLDLEYICLTIFGICLIFWKRHPIWLLEF